MWMIKAWKDTRKGVEVNPSAYANEATVCYNGLLAKSGADQIYLHCGFGDPRSWSNVTTQKMERSPKGWEKNIRLTNNQAIICFKDSANNWDNNNGHNWNVH
jgi:hypothetical protein